MRVGCGVQAIKVSRPSAPRAFFDLVLPAACAARWRHHHPASNTASAATAIASTHGSIVDSQPTTQEPHAAPDGLPREGSRKLGALWRFPIP